MLSTVLSWGKLKLCEVFPNDRNVVDSRHFVLHGFDSLIRTFTLKRNFQFDGFSVVRWGDIFIDLHNAYNLECFGTDLIGGEVNLIFAQNEYAIDPDKLPSKVKLSCTGNVRVAFNNLCEIAAPLDDEGSEIAYFDAECDWSSFLDEDIARSQEPLGLHVSFINGLAVRIFCDEAMLIVQ
jgi:hypothetical protein